MITKIAWKNIWFKPLNTLLSIILLTASVAIITLLILLQDQFEKKFSDNIDGIDMVLGAQGSPLQLILSSVYQVDAPTGNIDYTEAKKWMKHPFVETAIPLAFGDNYRGFRIVGTTPEYLHKYGAEITDGKVFDKNFEVVVGSAVAQKMNIKLGDKFFGSHGDSEEGEVHENHAYIVTGIASSTGKVVDNLILSNIPSVWAMHDHEHDHEHEGEALEDHDHEGHDHHDHEAAEEAHDHEDHMAAEEEGEEHHHEDGHDHDHAEEVHDHVDIPVSEEGKEITAVLIKFKSKMGIVTWPRLIPQNTKMQGALPAIEINRLFTLFGIGLDALQYLAYGIMLISGISIFIALFNTLKERKYEFALLRVNGASRLQLLMLVLIESLLLCFTGYIFGTIVGRLALSLISGSSESEFKISFNPLEFVWEKEGYLFLLTIFVGVLAAVIPAVKAYGLNISKTLANA
ncbi:FtsX-like permease family protein [Flavobacterium alkalisoli]|uniref:FtsX-like permease family protein n=1 Tax=Flavobacterium alkalisoli TaxID=2602769 RepID=A0A5B9FTJ6_9FLAO|nr:ABC transporter permease [Flavobacterium alkalisoli]QEE49386.1 FtsX-like permease family protein [Flavobacterium alkalisoli]